MVDPYRMVAVNITAVLILLSVLLLFKIFFPKKKINLFALLISISILPIISIFRKGVYESGDFSIHLFRSIDFYQSLREGILLPSWAAGLNGGFGYPLFIFNYTLPYYPIALFHMFGFSFIASMKLFLILSYIFSGITMYLASKEILKDDKGAFVSAIFYLFIPYHLIDLHFRVAVGEVLAFTLLPLLLLLIYRLSQKPKPILILWTGTVFALCFLAHQATTLFSLIPFGLYSLFIIFSSKKELVKKLFSFIFAIIIGILLSFFSWIPHFHLIQYTKAHLLSESVVLFVKPMDLLLSPWRHGFLFQGSQGELAFIIGYTQIFILLASLLLIFKKRKFILRSKIIFWTLICLLLIFLITPYSFIFWKYNPLLNFAQFSYRFLLPLSVSISLLAGLTAVVFKSRSGFVYLLILITIAYTILNWGNRKTITDIDDSWLFSNQAISTSTGEGLVEASSRWLRGKHLWITPVSQKNIELVNGKGEIKEIFRSSTKHEYLVNAPAPSVIKENTQYFPGWSAKVNGENVSIDFQNKKYPAIMIVNIPKGISKITFEYKDVPELAFLKQISLLGFAEIGLVTILHFVKKIRRKKN